MEMNYKELSGLAREVERAGDLSYAASVWHKAAGKAKKEANKQWAVRRAAFCERWCGRIEKEKNNDGAVVTTR
ncbi:hypothetical protein A6046_03230 [[Haemophilus] ducreyi]|nr:ANR family transcriptional regulator [[Haemophilus] ducreyi]AKO30278.1 hypothetical protein RY60_00375 [[Haemophilus] ducreyi]AKO31711.1 hypothetical protein RZ57_00380 [[Haemophilus] ducreyi]AKO33164.1 hypothetical protein RZ58_00380 [[Haemophilus] ducreyi]AKO34613.1 hypothetical protein RZ59_00375 [[Haemophilus] ducreyi]AKO36044.1 hypothetical protein RZ61_00370 [[Haemophilus] ducreyi]